MKSHGDDLTNAHSSVSAVLIKARIIDLDNIPEVMTMTEPQRQEANAPLRRCKERTKLVEQHGPAITRVADALLSRVSLDSDEVDGLIAGVKLDALSLLAAR